MFAAIEPLLRHCTKLTLSLQMKGDEMVVCVMPQGTAKDAAMLQPLALTATAAELDVGFIDALVAYTGAHASLAEQVAATKTLAKGSSKPASPAPGRSNADADNDDDDGSADAEGQSTAPTASSASPAAEASAEPANTGTNLASLFD